MNALSITVLLLAAGGVGALAQQPSTPPAPASRVSPAPAQKAWFIRLIPPRPTFDQDMTGAEQKLMEQHFDYWKEQSEKGVCLFGGPILDPKGVYGVLVLVAASEDEARAIAAADPSVKAGVNRIEVAPMRIAFLPKTH